MLVSNRVGIEVCLRHTILLNEIGNVVLTDQGVLVGHNWGI